ncbi:hypothetical protein PR003_g14504 [Phytophthora rubi]|uniref:Uncharacterized protein n=2 Tax=Phytophthora TaxID=4783 RepID=A0A6A3LKN3_9STRA|nr:hypothetical protein PR002_g14643 [Phytophthora rubi]KAE9019739.1 hypothetical protein PR001_g13802 [Phytophthora rubi]KAE9332477.1 hypothetical protein PR003_g14504 [Phytophthora rubi]KAE9344865.1 hypothetical protein PF008_g9026 [Phytophthora fragariae]
MLADRRTAGGWRGAERPQGGVESGRLQRRWEAVAQKKKDTLETEIFVAKHYNTVDAETEEEFETRRAAESMEVYLDKEWWPHKHKFCEGLGRSRHALWLSNHIYR